MLLFVFLADVAQAVKLLQSFLTGGIVGAVCAVEMDKCETMAGDMNISYLWQREASRLEAGPKPWPRGYCVGRVATDMRLIRIDDRGQEKYSLDGGARLDL